MYDKYQNDSEIFQRSLTWHGIQLGHIGQPLIAFTHSFSTEARVMRLVKTAAFQSSGSTP